MAVNGGLARPSAVAVGAALVALYVATVVGTMSFGHHVRPLFEGIGPPPPYRWVHPPPGFASGNVPPNPNEVDVPLGPQGSEQSGAQSEDNQLVLNLAPKAAPPHPPDTTVKVRVEPLDPATLGPVPPDLRPNGNAYRVTLTYQPSGTPLASMTTPGNILLTVPEPTAGLLYAADGRSWQRVGSQTVAGQPIVGGPFTSAGYYLGAAHRTAPTTPGGGGGVSGTIVVAVLVAGVGLTLGLFPVVRRRIRARRKPAPKGRRPRPRR